MSGCVDLAGRNDVSVLVTERDGQLSRVLSNANKEHATVLLFRDRGKVPHWEFPPPLALTLASISKTARVTNWLDLLESRPTSGPFQLRFQASGVMTPSKLPGGIHSVIGLLREDGGCGPDWA